MLDENSFFEFIETRSLSIETKIEQSYQLKLACFTIKSNGDHKCTLYDMPEQSQSSQLPHAHITTKLNGNPRFTLSDMSLSLEEVEQIEKTNNVKPLDIKGPSILESLGLWKTKILQFLKVQTERGTNYLLIQAGGRNVKSSIMVLDSRLQMKQVTELEGWDIRQVAKNPYQGHLFAVDANQNVIAIDIQLVC